MRRAHATTVTVTNAITDEADQTAESGQSHRSSDGPEIDNNNSTERDNRAYELSLHAHGLREHHSRNTNLMLLYYWFARNDTSIIAYFVNRISETSVSINIACSLNSLNTCNPRYLNDSMSISANGLY